MASSERFAVCPACEGYGVEVNPRLRKQDGVCQLCFGLKMVALEPCRCGRPRRFDEYGWVEEAGIFCCGKKECREHLEKRKEVRGEKVWTWSGYQGGAINVRDFRRFPVIGGWSEGWMGGGD